MRISVNALTFFLCVTGITTEPFSKLRVAGLFGPAELFLSLAILFALIYPKRVNPTQRYVHKVFGAFFFFWFVILILGTLCNWLFLDYFNLSYAHNSIAIVLNMFLSVFVFSTLGKEESIKLIKYVVVFVTLLNLALYCSGLGFFWYSTRFSGLAINPNQLALSFAPLPFFVLYILFKFPQTRTSFLGWSVIGLLATFLGWMTKSQSLETAYVVVIPLCLLMLLYSKSESVALKGLLMTIALTLVCIFIYEAIIFWQHHGLGGVYGSHGAREAQSRFGLWSAAFFGTMKHSPFFGLGPGSLVNVTLGNLMGGSDTANTYVGIFLQSGWIGVFLFGWLFWLILKRIWVKRGWLDVMPMFALMVFITFQYMLRHPMFWFVLVWTFLTVHHNYVSKVRN